jgi:hypothetical protein
MLAEQGFVMIYEHVSKLKVEASAGAHALHPVRQRKRQIIPP